MTEETRRAGRVLAGAVFGCATGISALLLYTNGQFVAGLTSDFGLTRTQFGFGVLLVTLALAVANPLVGRAVDRFGARAPAIAGLLLLSAGFASLGALVHSLSGYLLIQTLVAFCGAASGPIPFTQIIGANFDRSRGLALGVTMTGIGIAAAVVPPVLASVIATHGWRAGFLALSVVPLAGVLAILIFIPGRVSMAVSTNAQVAPAAVAKDQVGQADAWMHGRVFWSMAAAFALMALSFAGLLPHFVPMLTDGGISPVKAAGIASEIGLAVIASRLVVGALLDRLFAPWVAVAMCLVAAGGFLSLIVYGASAAPVMAIALGFAMGAELDLMGFLVARYFGLGQFGRIYGWLYGAFILASGLAPLWVGALRDATGDYTTSLIISASGLAVACAAFLRLPRYVERAPAAAVSSIAVGGDSGGIH
jgi:MFS family permease